jgi:hypothetical protein
MSWLQSWMYSLGRTLGGVLKRGRTGDTAPQAATTEGGARQTRATSHPEPPTADISAQRAKREEDKSRATQEYQAEIEATREQSARLKELRLAKEMADREAAAKKKPAAAKRSRPSKKK